MSSDEHAMSICCECIGDSYLKEEIESADLLGDCSFCENTGESIIQLADLGERVHGVLEEHFRLTSPEPDTMWELLAQREGYWDQPGDPIADVIVNLIDSSEPVAEALHAYLSDAYDAGGKDALIDLQPYDDEAYYDERPIDTYEFSESWNSFKHDIYTRARFFNRDAEAALRHLFDGVGELVTLNNEPVIRELTAESQFFRARVANTDDALKEILKKAPESLGAPQAPNAKSGRMNAEGIGLFYGAMDVDTCIAEIRAPVGSSAVIGRFVSLRNLRLLDLSRLKDVYLRGSLFDSKHTESLSRLEFLKRLVGELSAPVMPGAEMRDYLPTQVVAEFLAAQAELTLDGVMFASSQVVDEGRAEADSASPATPSPDVEGAGKNIVLFPHACSLEPYDLPDGAEIDVYLWHGDPEDGDDDSIFVRENSPDESTGAVPAAEIPVGSRTLMAGVSELSDGWTDDEPSIRLDVGSIEVRVVQGVSYQTRSRDVSRHRVDNSNRGRAVSRHRIGRSKKGSRRRKV